MYCSKCGKQLPDGVTSCPDCDVIVEQVYPKKEEKQPFFKMPGKA